MEKIEKLVVEIEALLVPVRKVVDDARSSGTPTTIEAYENMNKVLAKLKEIAKLQ